MDDVKKEAASPGVDVRARHFGMGALQTTGGWQIFLRSLVTMEVTSEASKKLGLSCDDPNCGSFQMGVQAMATFGNNMMDLANEFCQAWLKTLYDKWACFEKTDNEVGSFG